MTSRVRKGPLPAINPRFTIQAMRLGTKAVRYVVTAVLVSRERRALASLDNRMLKDIGLSRSLAEREIARDFFDFPEHRIG